MYICSMQEYIYEDQYKGKTRKLLILMTPNGQDYRVFCDSNFMGSITTVQNAAEKTIWKSEYNILKPIVSKIGEHIESFHKADLI